jgi:Peptidase family U32
MGTWTLTDRTLADAVSGLGLPGGDLQDLPDSALRFPDGAQYRFEIPSTEGPACLEAVLAASRALGVPVHRVSQGSGLLMHTRAELLEMGEMARENGSEVSLFARPSAGWDTGAMAHVNAVAAGKVRGQDGLVACLREVARAAELGYRSVLLSDEGALWVADQLRAAGTIPVDMRFKVSVMAPAANAASALLLVRHGASTLNLPTDLTLPMIAAIRQVVDVPLDVYIESPDDVGGFVRQHEVAELIRVAAPVYVKLGLRNAPNIYPYGEHLKATALALSRERVHRAAVVAELLEGTGLVCSELGAEDLAVPLAPVAAAA